MERKSRLVRAEVKKQGHMETSIRRMRIHTTPWTWNETDGEFTIV
jgi:hypothetical protein